MTTTVASLTGKAVVLDDSSIENLAGRIGGRILRPSDRDYDEAISIWNGLISRRPGIVVQPSSSADVVATVEFVRDHGLELSIKGGGHNIAGLALSDGGVTLDMSQMRTVDVDVETMTARVGPGCTLGDVDHATQKLGLATTLGFVSETGVAGLTLGGGFGYLTRQNGWTVDDLLEVEVVTADGRVLRANMSVEADLFWAIRGGGGNFGVVTEFVFRLHHVGPDVTGGLIAWSAEEAPEVLRLFGELTALAPRELTIAVLMRNAPAAPWLPEHRHGQPMIAFVLNHCGTPEEAAADMAPIQSFGSPWADLIARKPYVDQQSMLDATQPKGMHYYWKSEFLPELTDGLFEMYRAQFEDLAAPANQYILFHIGGAVNEHAEDDGAVGNRDAAFAAVIQSMWPANSDATESNREWVRSAWEATLPYSTGGNYINFQTDDEADLRIADSYRQNLVRLEKIKTKYDPDNLFRVNRNIQPG